MESSTTEKPVKRKQPAHLGTHGRKRETDVPWPEIKAVVEAGGMSLLKASKRWNVSYERLKKHSQRNGWVIPSTLIAVARERAQELGIEVPRVSLGGSETLKASPETRENIGTALVESLDEMGQEGSLIAARLSLGLLRGADANPERLMPIVDGKDIATNLKVVRTAAGLDRATPAISLSLWGGPMSPPGTSRDNVRDVSGSVLDDWEA